MSLTKETISIPAARPADRSPTASTGKAANDHAQPVCIEIPVTVQGVRPATAPGKREPFTESTRTVIVFANGAVLRLGASVNPGQLIFLTNEQTQKEVVCQVVKSKSYQNVPGYVELEFTEPNVGFWGMHFPGERVEPPASADVRPAPKLPPTAPPLSAQSSLAASPHSNAASVPPAGIAESQPASRSESHPAPPPPAETACAVPPSRKEPSHAEEPPAVPPQSPPSSSSIMDANLSEPLVFSRTNRSIGPSASAVKPHTEVPAAPASGSRSLFGEEAEPESAEPAFRHMPVSALIAAGLILAAAGGGWYWWHNRGRSPAAESSTHPANPPAVVTPPSADAQTAFAPSSPSPSISTASASEPSKESSKPLEASAHSSTPAPVQPVSTAMTSREASRPAEKSAEARTSADQPERKPTLSGFRLSTPTVVSHASAARNPELTPAPAVPISAPPAGIESLVGSTDQPGAPKPEAPTGGELKQARLISSVPPTYPPLARSQRIEGDVTLDALIDASGRVTAIKVISGPVLLQQAAVAAVRMWKYEPANLNGAAVPMHLVVVVKFRLR